MLPIVVRHQSNKAADVSKNEHGTGKSYKDILDQFSLIGFNPSERDYILQKDKSPSHHSIKTKAHLSRKRLKSSIVQHTPLSDQNFLLPIHVVYL